MYIQYLLLLTSGSRSWLSIGVDNVKTESIITDLHWNKGFIA